MSARRMDQNGSEQIGTVGSASLERSVYCSFVECVRRNPAATAVLDGDRAIAYAELNGAATALAHSLRSLGIGVGDAVAVMMPRSADIVVAQIAIFAIGAVYVPIDPDWPSERRNFILEDAKVSFVLGLGSKPDLGGRKWVDTTRAGSADGTANPVSVPMGMHSSWPAYIMYTSGSTGVPKGVVVPHSAIINLASQNEYVEIERTDCVAYASNPAFDASTFEVWGTLLNGAQLVVVPKNVVIDAALMARFISTVRINILFLTTSIFNQYVSVDPAIFSDMKCVLFGGEACNAGAVQRVMAAGAPTSLLNMYGPTESTTFATYWKITGTEGTVVPIGRPLSNVQIYILDEAMNRVPVDHCGEIYIGGAGVTTGYLNKPKLTEQRFVADPFSNVPSARLYKTGDLGRQRTDGAVEYLGRNDRQVKIRGFRIEPEEIESVLNTHELVAQSAVICRSSPNGANQLISYVTLSAAGSKYSAQSWAGHNSMFREYLRTKVPDHMVPSYVIVVDAFPFTSTGKIDRREVEGWALPERERDDEAMKPRTSIEILLAEVWEKELGTQHIGLDDNFFDVGGDSILAARIATEVGRRLGHSMTAWTIFEHPTIREMVAMISHPRDGALDST